MTRNYFSTCIDDVVIYLEQNVMFLITNFFLSLRLVVNSINNTTLPALSHMYTCAVSLYNCYNIINNMLDLAIVVHFVCTCTYTH